MRLWSVHPKYLDKQGLTACWREGLLAASVLRRIDAGEIKVGYRNHSQLVRFKAQAKPRVMVSEYLHYIVDEATTRKYSYDRSKLFPRIGLAACMELTTGQLGFEWWHLLNKIMTRSPDWVKKNLSGIGNLTVLQIQAQVDPHPLFTLVKGEVADWEKV